MSKVISDYIGKHDWRIKENASVGYSLGGLILHTSGTEVAKYWLNNVYPEHISEAHKNGDFHIHDLSMLSTYCCGWSLRDLLLKGISGVRNKVSSAPAKHLSTIVNQMVNFFGLLQNEAAGAQAFSSFDTYLAPFIKVDNLDYATVKQEIQSFVFGVNTCSRWGSQAPFTNITLDWTVPKDMAEQPVIIGGELLELTYGECQNEMDMINKAFLEIMLEGDHHGRTFSYPIPTYNITDEFVWDSDNAKLLFSMAGKYGTPYFQNFLNSDLDPSAVRSMCCRLRLDKRELLKRGGGLFGANELTGSVGVVTLNLPRLAYISKNIKHFFKKLDRLSEMASESLEIKRSFITDMLNRGMYPYTKEYLKNWNNHFSTIGVIGANEACLNLFGKDITTDEGKFFAEQILDFLRTKMVEFQERTGNLYNLEATPGESTSYRLAKNDRKQFGDIITSGDKDPYYTNSTQMPVNYTDDLFKLLDDQVKLQSMYTGGTVVHGYLDSSIDDSTTVANLVKKIASNYKIPYFTISPVFSVCTNHGYIRGAIDVCPDCGEDTEVFERIVGYYRPISNWNKGKSQEQKERIRFDRSI